MDVNWQFNNPPNPTNAAIGNQVYDNHLYYAYGVSLPVFLGPLWLRTKNMQGVAQADPDSYLSSICNLKRVQNDQNAGNSPLWFGEWALATEFTTDDTFIKRWADAQKMAYSAGAGWIYWNFKMESSSYSNQWWVKTLLEFERSHFWSTWV